MSFLMFNLSILFSLALTFFLMSHPLSMGLIIMMSTLGICLASVGTLMVSWYSFILFLVFLGAIMVLFMYVASLASNELFNKKWFLLLLPIFTSPFMLFSDYLLLPNNPSGVVPVPLISLSSITNSIFSIYSPPTFSMTLFAAAYLLLTLLVVVELSTKNSGPLRSN